MTVPALMAVPEVVVVLVLVVVDVRALVVVLERLVLREVPGGETTSVCAWGVVGMGSTMPTSLIARAMNAWA
ncbi:MAG: hypothetical protein ACLPZR_12060 [Solirubrobacteraceae bacterium]